MTFYSLTNHHFRQRCPHFCLLCKGYIQITSSTVAMFVLGFVIVINFWLLTSPRVGVLVNSNTNIKYTWKYVGSDSNIDWRGCIYFQAQMEYKWVLSLNVVLKGKFDTNRYTFHKKSQLSQVQEKVSVEMRGTNLSSESAKIPTKNSSQEL